MTFHHIFRHFVSDNIKEDYSRGLLYLVLSHANAVSMLCQIDVSTNPHGYSG